MVRGQTGSRFMRVGSHLINLEAILEVNLRKDDSAVLTMQGPRKSLQQIPVPAPAGRELWEFVLNRLAVVEFGELPQVKVEASPRGRGKGGDKKPDRKPDKKPKEKKPRA